MSGQTRGLLHVRQVLKQWSILIYTGNALDDIVLMEMEVEELFENKHLTNEEYLELRMILKKSYREAGGTPF